MEGKNFSESRQRIKYVVMDFVTTFLAFFVFDIFRCFATEHAGIHHLEMFSFLIQPKIIVEQFFFPLALMSVYWMSGFYNRPLLHSRLTEFSLSVSCASFNAILIYLLLMVNDSTRMRSREYLMIIVLFALLFSFTYFGRWIISSRMLRRLREKKWMYTTLIVGNSPRSRKTYRLLSQGGSVLAYRVVGFVAIPGEDSAPEDGNKVWDMDEMEEVCRRENVDQIVISPQKRKDADVMRILNRLFPLNVGVSIAPDTLSFVTQGIRLDDIYGVPLVSLTSPRLSEFQKNLKRTIDVVVSSIALIILSPLLAILAAAVHFSSPGPVIYSQERIGKRQRPFKIYKFRSMRVDAEASGPQLSHENDPRITPLGAVMRKYRLDELPQFWNVLRGDMSLVGPRPEREYFIRRIVKQAPYYNLLFQVKPGITSWGMVKYGYASNVKEMVRRSNFDLIYLSNMSVATDIKILIYTVMTIIKGKGV